VPTTEQLLPEFRAAGTQVLGVSIDSIHSHAAWGRSLGGISFPLLADFHPKGELARKLGVYLEEAGITDRATVLIDKEGIIRFHESVTPGGQRDIQQLVAEARKLGGSAADVPTPGTVPDGVEMFYKQPCGASERARATVENLHLQDRIRLHNVSADADARTELVKRGGKDQAPCLWIDGKALYEASDIMRALADRIAPIA
jgi:glutaredoxin-related protein